MECYLGEERGACLGDSGQVPCPLGLECPVCTVWALSWQPSLGPPGSHPVTLEGPLTTPSPFLEPVPGWGEVSLPSCQSGYQVCLTVCMPSRSHLLG